ncbi:PLP-dependent aminotransferase family protein [Microbacterium telephonicum]|uniref:GntR family transcriptional regulator n=1 Tax=Microbacterium telephonicum TaxID=1714841 RepID=A0A498CA46_9MICO|nr:PLP-dependent aminotransferase family protein [Microbacterium telephonicum]RLK49288.1 GntR family transcriptional regulator [Microbacterium telephonicum]
MDSRIGARALAVALGAWRTREPAYEALADGIRLLCLDNRIAPRTTLPAERELATILGLSRATIAAAYRSLRESDHVESVRGSGTVTLPLGRRTIATTRVGDDEIDLQQASPAAWPGLAGVMTDVAQDAAALVARAGYDVVGHERLREAIAARYDQRGLPTSADEILVTTGAQSAIHLLATTLLRRGDPVLIETPTYPHATEALRGAGARLVSVPVDAEAGWDLDRARQAFARTRPSLAYLMPQFQNPTGRTMSETECAAVAEAAARAGTVLVVDETTAELYVEPPATAHPPLPFDGCEGAVVRLGSLGKTVWGGLRIGWIRADRDTVRRLVAARAPRDLGTPEFEQVVAARLLARMPEILAQRSTLLRAGRDALVSGLRARLPEWRVPVPAGGVAVWAELGAPLSSPLVIAARERGLHLSPGARFAVDGGHDRRLRLPFTASVDHLTRAVDILAETWPRVREAAPVATVDVFDAVV